MRAARTRRFLPGICRVYGWAGTAPRYWGSSWQPGTQKTPKAQPLRRLSGHGLRWGHCSFAQCFCAGSVSGALACWCCFLRCAGDFSASAQPPWQRLFVAGRVVGAVGGTAVLCRAGACHKGNAGDRAAAFEPFCGCNSFVSGRQCCRGCPRPRCRQRAMRAFPPHTSDWPAGRQQRLFLAAHG